MEFENYSVSEASLTLFFYQLEAVNRGSDPQLQTGINSTP